MSVALLGWSTAPASAQTASIDGPIAGFLYNQTSRTVRPLLGVPGAAHIGSPVLRNLTFASISPNGDWALVRRGPRFLFLRGLARLAPAESAADGLIDGIDRVVWNRDGSCALLYSSTNGQLQRVVLSSTGVAADTPIDLSPWGAVAALAVDPAGRQIVFGVANAGLFSFAAGQPPVLLSHMAQPVMAAFDSTGQHLYAADADRQQIVDFNSGSGGTVLASLTDATAAAAAPAGLAVSGDGRYLMLADSAAQAVRVYDTGSGNLAMTIPSDFRLSRFEAMSQSGTFLLNGDKSNEWLLLLDARQLPHLSFVPATPEKTQ